MMLPALQYPTRGFLDRAGKNKCIRIGFMHKIFQPSQFKPRDNREDDIHFAADVKFAGQKAALTFIYCDPSSEFIHELVFDGLAFTGNNCDPGISLYTLHHIIYTTGSSKISKNRIQGGLDSEFETRYGENEYINSQDDLRDGE